MKQALLPLAALALVLAGCGSKSPRQEYVSKLNAMCEDFAQREQEIGEPTSTADLQARGDRIVAAFEETILRPIEALEAPRELEGQAARLRRLSRRQDALLRGLNAAAKAGDVQRIRRLAVLNSQVNAQAGQVAGELDADSCARAPD